VVLSGCLAGAILGICTGLNLGQSVVGARGPGAVREEALRSIGDYATLTLADEQDAGGHRGDHVTKTH
jgi:hypothetical protein